MMTDLETIFNRDYAMFLKMKKMLDLHLEKKDILVTKTGAEWWVTRPGYIAKFADSIMAYEHALNLDGEE